MSDEAFSKSNKETLMASILIARTNIFFRHMILQYEQWFGVTMMLGWLQGTIQVLSSTGRPI
jgi:hypothetical protein